MAWYDPATSYAGGGLDRETGQNIPAALWQRLMDSLTHLGGTTGNTKSGTLSIPAQPAFLAHNSADDANATGNGAAATVDFDTEIYDQANNFASDTFTAPVTGKYLLSAGVRVSSIPAGATTFEIKIVTSNRSYRRLWVMTAGLFSQFDFDLSVVADMDAADTATVVIIISGGAGNTASITGAASSVPDTFFSGHLVA